MACKLGCGLFLSPQQVGDAPWKNLKKTNLGVAGQKCCFWTFWWFSGWISAKLALIWSKMHLQHDRLALLATRNLGSRRNQNFDLRL